MRIEKVSRLDNLAKLEHLFARQFGVENIVLGKHFPWQLSDVDCVDGFKPSFKYAACSNVEAGNQLLYDLFL